MAHDDVLSAGAATAVWAVWTAIELGYRRHPAIPSRDWDQGSLLALNVAHGFRLAGMLVGFLGVGRIDGAGAPLQLSGLGLNHPYCSRRAFNGSAIPARNAGTNAAATPTPNNAAAAEANAMGSRALTSKRNDDSSCVSIAAPAMPATIPADTSIAPWPRT